MDDFYFTPTPDGTKLPYLYLLLGVTVAGGILMRMTDTAPLLGEILFVCGAAFLIWTYLRYSFASYTYTLAADGIFEVTRREGKKITVLCSVRYAAFLDITLVSYREKPKKAFSCLATFMPDKIISATVDQNGTPTPLLLSYDPDFFREMTARVRPSRDEEPY